MKQTVEEAAREYRVGNDCRTKGIVSPNQILYLMENAFKAGAEWQEMQAPWISVDERYPGIGVKVLIGYEFREDIIIDTAIYKNESFYGQGLCLDKDKVMCWLPIPSFDEILEANKDVLQRLKDK